MRIFEGGAINNLPLSKRINDALFGYFVAVGDIVLLPPTRFEIDHQILLHAFTIPSSSFHSALPVMTSRSKMNFALRCPAQAPSWTSS